jgi:hypothetical protein
LSYIINNASKCNWGKSHYKFGHYKYEDYLKNLTNEQLEEWKDRINKLLNLNYIHKESENETEYVLK